MPSGGIKDTVPGDFAHLERRIHGWKEGIPIDPGGDNARVMSGVSDNRDVQSITPKRLVEMGFPFLFVNN